MKNLNLSALLAALMLFCFTSFSQEKTYTAADSEISAEVGENFTVSLECNQSTGYSWSLGMISDNSQIVVAGMDYDLPESSQTGQGGAEVWHLKAVAPGNIKLMFYYSRSWEKEAPAKTITYNVTVK